MQTHVLGTSFEHIRPHKPRAVSLGLQRFTSAAASNCSTSGRRMPSEPGHCSDSRQSRLKTTSRTACLECIPRRMRDAYTLAMMNMRGWLLDRESGLVYLLRIHLMPVRLTNFTDHRSSRNRSQNRTPSTHPTVAQALAPTLESRHA